MENTWNRLRRSPYANSDEAGDAFDGRTRPDFDRYASDRGQSAHGCARISSDSRRCLGRPFAGCLILAADYPRVDPAAGGDLEAHAKMEDRSPRLMSDVRI